MIPLRLRTLSTTAVSAGVVLALLASGGAAGSGAAKAPPPGAAGEAPTYTVRRIEGFSVHIRNDLFTSHKDLGDRALKLVSAKLYDITRVVPPKALAHLRKVHIWLERDNPKGMCAVYHPSPRWLTSHGQNPAKGRCVEIANAVRFLSWSNTQPSMVLHELAHAYHHQVLGYDNKDIQAAYKQAVASGRYEKVLYADGTEKRAYAMNNQMEYFAELTEAYFGVNDFYPFVRAEIAKHDPRMHAVLRKVWGR